MTYKNLFLGLALSLAAGCGDNAGAPGAPDAAPPAPPDARPAGPEAGAWRDPFILPGLSGTQARVDALARGPDGRLHAGGIFTDAAGVAVANVAAWDGARWHALGPAPDAWVRALAFDAEGTLWAAAGDVDTLRGRVARRTGSAWVSSPELDGAVTDLAITDDGVVAVGTFARSVARFDGLAWHEIGSGAIDGYATAVATSAGGICVAGAFASIGGVDAQNAACWDGDAWAPLGAGLPGGVSVLTRSPDGRWFAGGTLTFILEDGTYRAGVAVLDGDTWVPFEGGIDLGAINHVRDIVFEGDSVVVGGQFAVAGAGDGAVAARNLARWTPDAGWSELGGGTYNDVGYHSPAALGPYALLASPADGLVIGGLFSLVGAVPAASIAVLPPAPAQPVALAGDARVLGIGGFVEDLVVHDGQVIAAGGFRSAGATAARAIASLDANAWRALGNGEVIGIVRDVLVRRDGSIAICGELGLRGRGVAFAQWDGATWSAVGGPVTGVGFAMLEDAEGRLWLGGDLDRAGATSLRNLARLDGEVWSAAGAFDNRVTALVIDRGTMYAGGLFDVVDTHASYGLARLDADGWRPFGGVDAFGYVTVLASHPTLGLLVGGDYVSIGDEPIASLAAWDGQRWTSLGALEGANGPAFVSALAPYRDGVFVAGGFERAGGVSAARVAWFDGTTWYPLGAGLDDHAETLLVEGDTLWVGGPFTSAGGRPSSGVAAWSLP